MTRPSDSTIAEAIRTAASIEGWDNEALIVDAAIEALGGDDEALRQRVQRVYDAKFRIYGVC